MKRKFKPGEKIFTFEKLLQQQYVIVNYGRTNEKTTHISVILSQTVRTVKMFLDAGFVREAIRLTNREFYGELPCKEVIKIAPMSDLCNLCDHNTYPHELFVEDLCRDAAMRWLEEPVK